MNEKKDILGKALIDFQGDGISRTLEVQSEDFDADFMDVSYYFRDYNEMPEIEKKALGFVKGRVLEIGAGAGSHSLYLQNKGLDVLAIDISPGAVEVMKKRGIENTRCIDINNVKNEKFDSVLLLMNGIGIAGNISNLPQFLTQMLALLEKDGQLLFDSTDLRYLYEEADGSFYLDLNANYYGELSFRYKYKEELGEWFPWLYVDADTLAEVCESIGCKMELLYYNDGYHYLARISLV